MDNSKYILIEAMEDKVKLMKEKNKNLNIYQAVIDVEDDKEISFNVADNGQSSSILEFGTHCYLSSLCKNDRKETIKNNKS